MSDDLVEHLRTKVMTAAQDLIDAYFGYGKKSLARIPADPSRDADLVLMAGIKTAADTIARLQAELVRWDELHKAIAEMIGETDTWPEHGNAPLAIAVSYALRKREIAKLQVELAEARAEKEAAYAVGFAAGIEEAANLMKTLHRSPTHGLYATAHSQRYGALTDVAPAAIRALTAPSIDLDAIRREARIEALREAAGLCAVVADRHADMALTGEPAHARRRESAEAMATKMRHAITAMIEDKP